MARPEIRCVLDAKAKTGEGAVWYVAEQALFWVDIPQGLLHRFDPVTGENRTWPMGEPIGCLALRQTGGAVVALKSGVYLFDLESGAKTPLCSPEADRPANRFNDGATDPKGRLWAGTMSSRGRRSPPAPSTGSSPTGGGRVGSTDSSRRTGRPSARRPHVLLLGDACRRADHLGRGLRSGQRRGRRASRSSMPTPWPAGPTAVPSMPTAATGWPASAAGSSCASRPRARSTGSSTCRSSGPPSPCSGAVI